MLLDRPCLAEDDPYLRCPSYEIENISFAQLVFVIKPRFWRALFYTKCRNSFMLSSLLHLPKDVVERNTSDRPSAITSDERTRNSTGLKQYSELPTCDFIDFLPCRFLCFIILMFLAAGRVDVGHPPSVTSAECLSATLDLVLGGSRTPARQRETCLGLVDDAETLPSESLQLLGCASLCAEF